MKFNSKNSFQSLDTLNSSGKDFKFFNLKTAEKNGLEGISKLPKSLKVLLENLLRYEDDVTVDKKQILALKDWLKNKKSNTEIAYRPARTLLQDYTGIPAIADLAAMRDAVKDKKIDPKPVTFLNTFWFQFINPKSIIVGLTSISLFIDTQNNYLRDSITLTLVWFLMAVGSQSAWCLMGKYMRKFATSDKFIKNFNYTMSFLLIVCVILFYV